MRPAVKRGKIDGVNPEASFIRYVSGGLELLEGNAVVAR